MNRPEPTTTAIPTQWVGPLRISGNAFTSGDAYEEVEVPLATFETPLWPSVGRGASISREISTGITTTVVSECMTRSVLFVADNGAVAFAASRVIVDRIDDLRDAVASTTSHGRLVDLHTEIVGNLLYVRFELNPGDASGHNMVTKAADALMERILSWNLGLDYGSVSGNFCSDKKATAVNGILGRGKNVIAEIFLPHEVVERRLRTTASALEDLVVRKNLVGSTIAGALRSSNAHYANMLLGFFLATGQDAANIVEGSQGITYAEAREDGLYFSCTLPNIIVGTVGSGKHLPDVTAALERVGCREDREIGDNSRRLASLIAAAVLCGELSLLAAQTNPGELMSTHLSMER
ncbi:MAG: hydroxymethylglutaryl-CoA reductase [Corynebacterium variabile]|uniref:hydroxymethylglutaryl-CoA reductase n=1 Tax=Corynebacterium variabile TaxID=1727 RepID=UPI002649711B|nr:hydroxymethylglutaryl-CoA reductase [Corynebacterium variabile]MDN6536418.1 hydroxymethylglutaryl-CoA reductase [Corynebacterium variabile]